MPPPFNSQLLLCLLLSATLLCSCSRQFEKKLISLPPGIASNSQIAARNLLYERYEAWKNVPHRSGGLSKSGIDCSGFVMLTYREMFNLELPRTAAKQVKLGITINRNNLTAGDLLFFKTGWFTEHVGIYIEDGDFLHVSSGSGVTISKISEEYWSDAFTLAKRHSIK